MKIAKVANDHCCVPLCNVRDLTVTQQDGWKTQDGRMTKKCRARLCIFGIETWGGLRPQVLFGGGEAPRCSPCAASLDDAILVGIEKTILC